MEQEIDSKMSDFQVPKSTEELDGSSGVDSPDSAIEFNSFDAAKQSRQILDGLLDKMAHNTSNATDFLDGIMDESSDDLTAAKVYPTSQSAIKNGRKTMEDRHVIFSDLNKIMDLKTSKKYSYYAVFDGHAGVDCASYSSAHLHRFLVESEAFAEGRIDDAIREAFQKTDQSYCDRVAHDGIDNNLKGAGSTAIFVLIEDQKTVYLAWVGDSQAVLVKNGVFQEIMLPHKPGDDSEKERIKAAGGFIAYLDTWRLNGILSVSRAIGDPEYKPCISAEPDIAKFEIDPSLDFLVLGCDGLFDFLTGQDVAAQVFEYLCQNETGDADDVIAGVSSHLSNIAVHEGSNDNITSIVIFFKPLEQLVSSGLSAGPIKPEIAAIGMNDESILSSASDAENIPAGDYTQLAGEFENLNLHDASNGNIAQAPFNPFGDIEQLPSNGLSAEPIKPQIEDVCIEIVNVPSAEAIADAPAYEDFLVVEKEAQEISPPIVDSIQEAEQLVSVDETASPSKPEIEHVCNVLSTEPIADASVVEEVLNVEKEAQESPAGDFENLNLHDVSNGDIAQAPFNPFGDIEQLASNELSAEPIKPQIEDVCNALNDEPILSSASDAEIIPAGDSENLNIHDGPNGDIALNPFGDIEQLASNELIAESIKPHIEDVCNVLSTEPVADAPVVEEVLAVEKEAQESPIVELEEFEPLVVTDEKAEPLTDHVNNVVSAATETIANDESILSSASDVEIIPAGGFENPNIDDGSNGNIAQAPFNPFGDIEQLASNELNAEPIKPQIEDVCNVLSAEPVADAPVVEEVLAVEKEAQEIFTPIVDSIEQVEQLVSADENVSPSKPEIEEVCNVLSTEPIADVPVVEEVVAVEKEAQESPIVKVEEVEPLVVADEKASPSKPLTDHVNNVVSAATKTMAGVKPAVGNKKVTAAVPKSTVGTAARSATSLRTATTAPRTTTTAAAARPGVSTAAKATSSSRLTNAPPTRPIASRATASTTTAAARQTTSSSRLTSAPKTTASAPTRPIVSRTATTTSTTAARPGLTSTRTTTVPKPAVGATTRPTVPRTTSATTTAAARPGVSSSTRTAATIPKPAVGATTRPTVPRTTTTAARPGVGSTRPGVGSTTTTRPTTSPRTTTVSAPTRPAVSRTTTTGTTSTTAARQATSSSRLAAPRTTASAPTRPIASRTATTTTTTASRPGATRTSPAAKPTVGSTTRTAVPRASPKVPAESAAVTSPRAPEPVAPAPAVSSPKAPESSVVVTSPHLNVMGVENSLKEELENAIN